ncbi:MAG: hypothetical protein ACXVIU_09670 [Halobacteriota archaeon]
MTKFTEVSVISSPTEYEPPRVIQMPSDPYSAYIYCEYGNVYSGPYSWCTYGPSEWGYD